MTVRSSVWPVVWTLGGLLAIALAIPDLVTADEDGGVQIDIDTGLEGDEQSLDEIAELRATEALWDELLTSYVAGTLDLDAFRTTLASHRGAIRLEMFARTANDRSRWFDNLSTSLDRLFLFALVLLAGPFWVARRVPPDARRRAFVESVPLFVVTAAALMTVGSLITGAVMDIGKLQVAFASFGAPSVAGTDAFLAYLVRADDAQLTGLLEALLAARQEPIGSAGALEHLWAGYQAVHRSEVLGAVHAGVSRMAWLIELYAPLLALGSLVLAVRVIWPVGSEMVRYPIDASQGRSELRLRQFARQQLSAIFREVRIGLWTVLFVTVLVSGIVGTMMLLSRATVAVSCRSVLAADSLVAAGEPLPDWMLALGMGSLALFAALVTWMVVAPIGLVSSRAYLMLRDRAMRGRRFRDYPEFWRTSRTLLFRVALLAGLAAAVILALYSLMVRGMSSPRAQLATAIWLLGPGLGAAMWATGLFRRLRRVLVTPVSDEAVE